MNFERCWYDERSEESIKNALINIPTLNDNPNNIFRCTNESYKNWLSKMESLSKKKNGIKIH